MIVPHILGISGKTGAGKSTLAKILASQFKGTLISWDEFDEISEEPENYIFWFHNGQDYSEFQRKSLAEVLTQLKNGQAILHPASKEKLVPTNLIIFDAPLGRLHQETGRYIDIMVHIEVPLDILLCRRILRDLKETATKNDIIKEVEFYLNHSRPLYIDDDLKESADLIIDGTVSITEECQLIMSYLDKKGIKAR